jgi:hypothetical protein
MMHLVTDPRGFFYHRINPLWGRPLVEVATGRDINGKKIDMQETVKDILKSWIPIPGQGLIKKNMGDNFAESSFNAVAASVGLSNYPYKSDFEKYAIGLPRPEFNMTKEQIAAHDLRKDLEDSLRNKEPDARQKLHEALKEHKIDYRQMQTIVRDAKTDPFILHAENMTLDQLAEGIKNQATDEEKTKLLPLLRKKFIRKVHDLGDDDKKAYRDLINEIQRK